MRLATWILVLSVLNFGIGWVSSSLADDGDQVTPEQRTGASFGRKDHAPNDHRSSRTPFLGEVRELSSNLDLSQEQEDAFNTRVEEISQQVKEHERAIFALMHQSRGLIPEILTTAQLQKLEGLRQERGREFRKQSLDRTREWFRGEGDFEEGPLPDKVMAVFEKADERRHEFFGKSQEGKSPDDPSDWRREYEKLREQKYIDLAELIGAEQVQRYRDRYSEDHRGGWPGRGEGRDGRGGRRGSSGMDRRNEGPQDGSSGSEPYRGGSRRGGPRNYDGARR